MARAQLLIENLPISLYIHDGGDMVHVTEVLLPELGKTIASVGFDSSRWGYCLTQACHAMVSSHRQQLRKYWTFRRTEDRDFREHQFYDSLYYGFSLELFDGSFHGDLMWIYIARRDCFDILTFKRSASDRPTIADTRLVKRLSYDGRAIRLSKKERNLSKVAWPAGTFNEGRGPVTNDNIRNLEL
jgi:hypothetical protein